MNKKNKAENFTLKDQFGNKTTVKFPSDKAVVLVFGDYYGSTQVAGWVHPLYQKYADQIYIFGIAELSLVPWFAKPVVQTVIKAKSEYSIMLDWDGKVSESYNYEKEKAKVVVVSKEGIITVVKFGAVSDTALNGLYQEIDLLL